MQLISDKVQVGLFISCCNPQNSRFSRLGAINFRGTELKNRNKKEISNLIRSLANRLRGLIGWNFLRVGALLVLRKR